MGRFKQQCIQEQYDFFDDCVDLMQESETIHEFYAKFAAAEKDGDLVRPEHMSMTEFEEMAAEAWEDVWSDYLTPLS